MKKLLSTIMLLSLAGSLCAMEGQWEEKELPTQEVDTSYDIPFEEIEQFLNQGYHQKDEDGEFFESPGIAQQMVGHFALQNLQRSEEYFVCDGMKKMILMAVAPANPLAQQLLKNNLPLWIEVTSSGNTGSWKMECPMGPVSVVNGNPFIGDQEEIKAFVTLEKVFNFLKDCPWQFVMLLNDIWEVVKAHQDRAYSQPYLLRADEERVFNLLPQPIQDVLNEWVCHPAPPEEIEFEQESNKEEQ